MENNFMAHCESLVKSAVDSSKQLQALNLKLAEKLLKKHLELVNGAVDASNRVVTLLGEGKALPEILAAQAKLASEYGNRVFATTKEVSELFAASQSDYRAWLEQGVKTFSAQSRESYEQARTTFATLVPGAQSRKAA